MGACTRNVLMSTRLLIALVLTIQVNQLNSSADCVRRRDVYEYCMSLDKMLAVEPLEVRNDALATLAKVRSLIATPFNIGKPERAQLAEDWRTIVVKEHQQCSGNSLALIGRLAECAPLNYKSMQTLADGMRRYTSKCLTVEYLAKEIKKTSSGGVLATLGAGARVSKFLDHEFISAYLEAHPNESRYPISGFNNWRPIKAISLIAKRFRKDVLEKFGRQTASELFGSSDSSKPPSALTKYLDSHLFRPCKSFKRSAQKTMSAIYGASKYMEGGEVELDKKLDEQSLETIFRYRFCLNLGYEHKSRVVALVSEHFVFNKGVNRQ